jgi:hypothetical protein
MTEDELTDLQNQSVAVLGASLDSPKYVLPPAAADLLIAVTALCDEVRFLRGLLREVASTFDGVDPVGPPLREAIGRCLRGTEAPEV